MFSYILVVSTGYILLISICPMLKARKMKSIATSSIFANLFKNLGCKNMVAFYMHIQNLIDCFVFWICIAIQEKENEIL